MKIMALVGATYVPEFVGVGEHGWFTLDSTDPIPVAGFDWAVPVASSDAKARMLGADSVSVVPLASSGWPGSGSARTRSSSTFVRSRDGTATRCLGGRSRPNSCESSRPPTAGGEPSPSAI
jgi:hypothetical protein